MQQRFHLIAPAGSCTSFFEAMGIAGAAGLIDLAREALPNHEFTADESLFEPIEDPLHAGRRDDLERAQDIQTALADPNVTAIIAVRGGAWFTRILPRISFDLLFERQTPLHIFGFSELTTLINITSVYPVVRACHDMGPAFIAYGMTRYAQLRRNAGDPSFADVTPRNWMLQNWRIELIRYFRQVQRIVTGQEAIHLPCRLVRGPLPPRSIAKFIGGNLTVLSTLIGSSYAKLLSPLGRWLLLEDFNDKPERFDRFLAHLTLAGWFERCDGILLGDFHQADHDLQPAILEMLEFHLPPDRPPVLTTDRVGHTWPMTPVPINQPGLLQLDHGDEFSLHWPPLMNDR